ncbi:MAG: transketolase [Candidatus Melainabacteria bacterium]
MTPDPATVTAPGLQSPDFAALRKTAAQLRLDILQMIYEGQSGHPGTSLSCIDMLTTLWFAVMRHDATKPECPNRDRFILSKGHGAPALYATLMAAGYIPKEEIHTLRKIHTNLQGHPASRYVKGVDVSTGSLGQGLSMGVGMALGLRLDNNPAFVYVLMGDGELQEGNIWEAALSAPHHKVNRLIGIVDRNRLQIDGSTECVKALGEVAPKFAAFGWNVLEIADGNNIEQFYEAVTQARQMAETSDRPTVIVANTTKGKGVSFMENQAGWHGKPPNTDQYEQARAELVAALENL